jgi:hypothetical protein
MRHIWLLMWFPAIVVRLLSTGVGAAVPSGHHGDRGATGRDWRAGQS